MAKKRPAKKKGPLKGKAKKPLPLRGPSGRFLSKSDAAFAKEEIKQRKKDKRFSPIQERLKRTRTKKRTVKAKYKNKTRVTEVEKGRKYTKIVFRVRAPLAQARDEVADWIAENAEPEDTVWVTFITKENGKTYGSNVGDIVTAYSYLFSSGIEYGKKFGVNQSTKVTIEAVVIKKKGKL